MRIIISVKKDAEIVRGIMKTDSGGRTIRTDNRFSRGWKWLKRFIGIEPERRQPNPQMELFDGLHSWCICEDCGQEFWCLKGSYAAITKQCSRCYEQKIYEQFEKKLFENNAGENREKN